MRLIAVVLIWVVIIGGISLYMARQGREILPAVRPAEATVETETFFLELTLTFTAEKDPFALDEPDGASTSGLTVKMGDTLLPVTMDAMVRGVPFKAGPFTCPSESIHELYIQASPPLSLTDSHNALRLRVFEEGRVVAEKTLWAGPGQNLTGTLQFSLTPALSKDDHGH